MMKYGASLLLDQQFLGWPQTQLEIKPCNKDNIVLKKMEKSYKH